MSERFTLKRISSDAIERAVKRAEHYRLLNDPEQAESICLDILEVAPEHAGARIVLILALTDQFGNGGGSQTSRRARDQVAKLPSEYEREYYEGLIAERRGRCHIKHGGMEMNFAYEALEEAMGHYERAEALKPAGVDDAILRWNACARSIMREGLHPRRDEPETQLE